MSTLHTPGPWANGRHGAVVSSEPIPGITKETGHADTQYYGGYLICESIHRIEDARLIAAAPELLEVLLELTDIEGPLPGNQRWHAKAIAAIAKATGDA